MKGIKSINVSTKEGSREQNQKKVKVTLPMVKSSPCTSSMMNLRELLTHVLRCISPFSCILHPKAIKCTFRKEDTPALDASNNFLFYKACSVQYIHLFADSYAMTHILVLELEASVFGSVYLYTFQ